MGFSNQERININSKALLGNVIDANSVAQWYESKFPFQFIINPTSVFMELSSIPIASSLAQARTNATNNPTLLQDLSQNTSAIRLTALAGTNGTTYVAYSVYNDSSSAVLNNWLQPQLIQQSNGSPSIGYAINLYEGDPNSGGTLIATTDGTTGTGSSKTVGWIFNYVNGMLLLSESFKSSVTNPYIVGFRYIGKTGSHSLTAEQVNDTYVADQTLAIGDLVRFVTSSDVGLTEGRVIKSQNTTDQNSEVFGVCTSGATQGNLINVATFGKANVTFGSAPLSSDRGKSVYLSSTLGNATLTIPSGSGQTIFKIGKLATANGSDVTVLVTLNVEFVIKLG